MPAIQTYHPFKALYAIYAIATEALLHLPLCALLYIIPRFRPEPNWTLGQAVRVKLLRAVVHHSAAVEVNVPLSTAPGKEGDRFVLISPPTTGKDKDVYQGPLADPTTKPATIGGTWYPAPYPASSSSSSASNGRAAAAAANGHAGGDEGFVVLHFHGGAFVLGDGRERDCGHLARGLLKHAAGGAVSHVFCPQYRLAGPPTSARFPAPLQDAVTAYLHLLRECRIPARRIVVSGDSAGGNIVSGLLRYIAEHGAQAQLPDPACAFLWSPWANPNLALDLANFDRSPNYGSDYISKNFGAWGCRCYASHCDINDPYISASARPFRTPVPIWLQTGGREMLFHDNVEFFEGLKKAGNTAQLEIVPYAPHDIPLVGHIVGFSREYADMVKKATEYLRSVAQK